MAEMITREVYDKDLDDLYEYINSLQEKIDILEEQQQYQRSLITGIHKVIDGYFINPFSKEPLTCPFKCKKEE